MRCQAVVFLVVLLFPLSTYAEVIAWSTDRPDFPTSIQITGTITVSDVKDVAAAIRASVPKVDQAYDLDVLLNSDGGDVEAAMAIGRLIRTRTARVDVSALGLMHRDMVEHRPPSLHQPWVCASSCVLILASGSARQCLPQMAHIGIHRPYSTTPVRAGQDTRKRYAALAAEVKSYLEEMGMPNQLYEAMMRVSAEDVRWLSFQECLDFGLQGTDAAYTDFNDSRRAAALGISKQEYLRRKAMVAQKCIEPSLQRGEKPFDIGAALNGDKTGEKLQECIKRVETTGKP